MIIIVTHNFAYSLSYFWHMCNSSFSFCSSSRILKVFWIVWTKVEFDVKFFREKWGIMDIQQNFSYCKKVYSNEQIVFRADKVSSKKRIFLIKRSFSKETISLQGFLGIIDFSKNRSFFKVAISFQWSVVSLKKHSFFKES